MNIWKSYIWTAVLCENTSTNIKVAMNHCNQKINYKPPAYYNYICKLVDLNITGRHTLGDKSQRQVTGTCPSDNSPHMTGLASYENAVAMTKFCPHNLAHEFKPALYSCDKSWGQNNTNFQCRLVCTVRQPVPATKKINKVNQWEIDRCGKSPRLYFVRRLDPMICLPNSAHKAAYRTELSLQPVAWCVHWSADLQNV